MNFSNDPTKRFRRKPRSQDPRDRPVGRSANTGAMAARPTFTQPSANTTAANPAAMVGRPDMGQGIGQNQQIRANEVLGGRPMDVGAVNTVPNAAIGGRPMVAGAINTALNDPLGGRPMVPGAANAVPNPALGGRPMVAGEINAVPNTVLGGRPMEVGAINTANTLAGRPMAVGELNTASADNIARAQASEHAAMQALRAQLSSDPMDRPVGTERLGTSAADDSATLSPLQKRESQIAAQARSLRDPFKRPLQQGSLQEREEPLIHDQSRRSVNPEAMADRPSFSSAASTIEDERADPRPAEVDPFRAQIQQAIQGRMGADPYAARQAAAESDYQAQAAKAREALSERLNRLGVLRGSGATASQFGEFESGVLRGQQAIGAQFEGQRQAGIEEAIRQGIGMYEAGGRQDISREQQRLQEIEMFGGEAGPEGRGTLARRLGVGGLDAQGAQLEEQRQARLQRGTEAEAERDLQREELYGGVTRPVDRAQTLAAREGAAGRTFLGGEAAKERAEAARQSDLRRGLEREELYGGAYDPTERAGLGTLAAREAATGREFQAGETALSRDLAREELYGQDVSGLSPMQIQALGGTLGARGQAAQLDAEDRRLTEMETAGVSQRGLAERELTQRSAMAAQQRELDREQLYGRAMTRAEQQSGLGYAEGTLAAQGLAQEAEQADLQRELAREEMYGGVTTAEDRARGASTLGSQELAQREAMQQAGFEEAGRGREFAALEAQRGRDFAQGQAGLDRALAEQELYGGTAEIRLDDLGIDPGVLQGYGARPAIEEALTQRLGRAPTSEEITSIEQGSGIMGRQTLAASEAIEGRAERATAAEAERTFRTGLQQAEFGERALDRDLTRDEADLQRDLAREEMYGGLEGFVDRREGTLAARTGDRDYRLRAELGRGGQAIDQGRLDLAEEELYGYREGAGGYREGTYQAREAGRGREEREGRYGVEDQRYDEALKLEADRYDTQRSDYTAALAREAEERAFQRQMQVLEVNRYQDEYGGYFNPREEDILGGQLDPNYQAPRNIKEWEDRNPKPTDPERLADWTEARGERLSQIQGDFGGKRDAWVRANPKMPGESDQRYAMRMLTAVRGPMGGTLDTIRAAQTSREAVAGGRNVDNTQHPMYALFGA